MHVNEPLTQVTIDRLKIKTARPAFTSPRSDALLAGSGVSFIDVHRNPGHRALIIDLRRIHLLRKLLRRDRTRLIERPGDPDRNHVLDLRSPPQARVREGLPILGSIEDVDIPPGLQKRLDRGMREAGSRLPIPDQAVSLELVGVVVAGPAR